MEIYAFWSVTSKPMSYFKFNKFILAAIFCLSTGLLSAQAGSNRVAVPIDATRPVSLRAHLVSGSITVKGADVTEITVEARVRHDEDHHEGGRAEGVRRIPMTSTGLNIESENTQVRM